MKQRLFCVILVGLVGGCSLVSGWSDLQGGAAARDAGAGGGDDDTPGDAAIVVGKDSGPLPKDSGPPVATGVHCGAVLCGAGAICCTATVASDQRLVCATTASCQGLPLPCTTHADCTGGEACCLGSNDDSSTCRAGCTATTDETLCSTNDTTACASNQTCALVSKSLPNWLRSCQ